MELGVFVPVLVEEEGEFLSVAERGDGHQTFTASSHDIVDEV